MFAYIIRRLLYAIPILFGVILITFVIFFTVVTPRDLARQALGEKANNPDQIADWMRNEGYAKLNEAGKAKVERVRKGETSTDLRITAEDTEEYGKAHLFYNYISDLLSFDFGDTRDKRPISEVLSGGMWPSLKLMLPIFILSEFFGLFFALFAALYRNTKIDRALVIASVTLMSVSPVAFILFAQKFFAAEWNYFPISGYQEGLIGYVYLALPIAIYVFTSIGGHVRFNRILVLDEIGQDYIRTAKAKGVRRNTILFRHALRNILIPLITRWATVIPFLFTGSLLLESFFGIPGLGGITVQAVQELDVKLIRALVYIGTILYIFSTLLSDVLYAVVDPRVKLQ